MKNLIIFFILGLSLIVVSCKKDAITPGNYSAPTPPPKDTTNAANQYVNGGVTPIGNSTTATNVISGTKWVLTQYRNTSYVGSTQCSDTISFISNTEYTINNGAIRTYTLSSIVGSTNKSLTLNFFSTFGGSHYSGQVGYYFVSDGVINSCEFHDMQNTSISFLAWFIKI